MIPGDKLHIKLKKARPSFYLMNKTADSKTTVKFLDAYLLVKRVQPNPANLSPQNMAPSKGVLARYNLMRSDLNTFRFSAASKSTTTTDNAVLGPIHKRLLFTINKNADFNG